MAKEHHYQTQLEWVGNLGSGTESYRSYSRNHLIQVDGKAAIPCSSDPSFRGDANRYNPEELLVASLSGCHMLWYLHLCCTHKIKVITYEDKAEGTMLEDGKGAGYFKEVILKPVVQIRLGDDLLLAQQLHEEANKYCFIANSVNFEVKHEPIISHYPQGEDNTL